MDFWAFVSDVGPKPDGCTLDRINNNGPYAPDNVRWSSHREQARNRRNNHTVVIEGVTYRLVDLADQYGKDARTIARRAAKGLMLEEILSERRQPRGDHVKAHAAWVAKLAARTHCKHGHERSHENVRIDYLGREYCRLCYNAKMRRRRERAKLLAAQ